MNRLIVLMCVIVTFSMQAQKMEEYKSKFYVQTTLMGIDAGRDFLVGNNIFVQTGLGLGAGYDVWNGGMSTALSFSKPIPYLRGGVDWYYNKENRIEKNRTLANNSGNYVGLQTKYSFGDSDEYNGYLNSVLVSEVHWGIKRTFGSVLYYKAQVGIGHFNDYDTRSSGVYPVVGLFIGATF